MNLKKFTIYLSILASILFAAVLVPIYFLKPDVFLIGVISIVSYYLLTLFAFALSSNGLKVKNHTQFMTYTFGAMTGKLLLSFVLIFIFLFVFTAQRTEFVISFLSAYLIFTSFEVYCLMLNLRRFSTSTKKS